MMGPGRGVRSAAGRLPGQRTENIGKTLRRLLARMRRELAWLGLALLMGVISVAFVVSGPKILGNATNVLFDGVVSKQFKTGTTKAQAVAQLRAHGHGQIADMVAKIARQELAARTAAGCIGVGLVITTHDMAGSDQLFAL